MKACEDPQIAFVFLCVLRDRGLQRNPNINGKISIDALKLRWCDSRDGHFDTVDSNWTAGYSRCLAELSFPQTMANHCSLSERQVKYAGKVRHNSRYVPYLGMVTNDDVMRL